MRRRFGLWRGRWFRRICTQARHLSRGKLYRSGRQWWRRWKRGWKQRDGRIGKHDLCDSCWSNDHGEPWKFWCRASWRRYYRIGSWRIWRRSGQWRYQYHGRRWIGWRSLYDRNHYRRSDWKAWRGRRYAGLWSGSTCWARWGDRRRCDCHDLRCRWCWGSGQR